MVPRGVGGYVGYTSDDMEARLLRYFLLTALVLRGICL